MSRFPLRCWLDEDEAVWHAWRKKVVTGTGVSALMGMNPYKTEGQLLDEYVMGAEYRPSRATNWGHLMEVPILGILAKVVAGVSAVPYPEFRSDEVLGASFDGRMWTSGEVALRQPAELLTSSPKAMEKAIEDIRGWDPGVFYPVDIKNSDRKKSDWAKLPEYYWAQMQVQMEALGVDRSLLVAKVGAADLRLFPVKKDEVFITEARAKAEVFLEKVRHYGNKEG